MQEMSPHLPGSSKANVIGNNCLSKEILCS
jgi:hypothetical protein